MNAPPRWLQADGAPVACVEKLKVLEENRAELAQIMQDAYEDAVLMGVDEAFLRSTLIAMVNNLKSPRE
ncbi:MAG TPA: hypothetical protein VMB71_13805 [Acetobacteraceae bacterium]|nr:hypothetical protein [Acetobacteraceae bacterium]